MDDLGYRTATVEDLMRSDGWAPIRRELGIRSFGVNAWSTAEIGGDLIPEHVELTHEELYVVIQGHATFTVDGSVLDAPARSSPLGIPRSCAVRWLPRTTRSF
jgi:mannose-6-phosphate isomerase-like protein (cupin superfamily)